MRENTLKITVVHEVLANPKEVNESGWNVAEYRYATVAITVIDEEPGDTIMETLEYAYFMTQTIDHPWYTNDFWTHKIETRSSMVGDRILIETPAGDVSYYKVSPVGFELLEVV